ncbi:deSI-like protein At4g17486 isoform X2 [Neltuma alba]|uniref:deSI-like protein At4g17486 isoform X2 n=1 Tax=Neltuma alba TaxID=207710 RepID=UPI0010A543A9|nr:deSI-like protein At4g17486 isoform X2 [Prosopis alba]
MTEVILHIYDVTNSGSERTNSTIVQINKIFKDGIGLGGIFHSAVQVYGEDEWSFGFCEQGSGVFSCPSMKNPMYTYRESIVLGVTDCSILKVNQIIRELSREWPGISYDLLSKNCNHFCDEFSARLGVPKLPGWVNLFANAGDSAMGAAENTAMLLRQARTEIVSASKVAYRFLLGGASDVGSDSGPLSNSNSEGSPRSQATWFKNLITTGAKPSSSSESQDQDECEQLQQSQEDDGRALHGHNSSSHDIS